MGEKKKHVALWSTGVIAAILLGSAAPAGVSRHNNGTN